jgi:hypothetical protein
MPFLTGAVTAQRFRVPSRDPWTKDDLTRLADYDFRKKLSPDGQSDTTYGWCASHMLDADFQLDKQLRGDFLCWGFRVSRTRIPPALLKAETAVALTGLMAEAGVTKANAKLKREAKEAALDRLTELAKDGRYTTHSVIPVAWDLGSKEVWYGHTSHAHLTPFLDLLEKTFGVTAEGLKLAGEQVSGFEPLPPWCADEGEACGAAFGRWVMDRLATGGEAQCPGFTMILNRSVSMECPNGSGGTGVLRHPSPTRMPEVLKAMEEGKVPTSLGFEAAVAGYPTNFTGTLCPHAWLVSGLKVTRDEDGTPEQQELYQLEAVREFFKQLDALYGVFLSGRATGVGG